jgi:hypothetical protein
MFTPTLRRLRLVAPVAAVALAASIAAPAALAESGSVDAPGGIFYSSFEASDPPAGSATYEASVNLTGKKYPNGSLMMYVDVDNVLGVSNYNTSEVYKNVVDGATATKWLSSQAAPYWVNLPLTSPQTVAQYTIGSANDATERDPGSWQLRGSNDATCAASPTTATWTTLDTQTGITWPTDSAYRQTLFTYDVPEANRAAYSCYE